MAFKSTRYGLNGPYLTVYKLADFTLRGRRWTVCIHHFHRGDEDPDCHDHPFDFWSMILWGGYYEHTFYGDVRRREPFFNGWFSYRSARFRHRVELIAKSCWTLCVKRSVNREWGFWKDGHNGEEFIPWRLYIEQKGLQPRKPAPSPTAGGE